MTPLRSPKPPEQSVQRKQSYIFLLHGRPSAGGNKADKNRASVSTWHLNQIQSTDLKDSSLPARATPERTGCPTSVSQVLRPLLTPGARLTAFAQKKTFLCGQTCQSSGIYRRTDKPQSPFFSCNVYPKYTVPHPSSPAENPNPPTAYQTKSPLETQTRRLTCKNRPLPGQRC